MMPFSEPGYYGPTPRCFYARLGKYFWTGSAYPTPDRQHCAKAVTTSSGRCVSKKKQWMVFEYEIPPHQQRPSRIRRASIHRLPNNIGALNSQPVCTLRKFCVRVCSHPGEFCSSKKSVLYSLLIGSKNKLEILSLL